MLAAVFVTSGWDTMLKPGPRVPPAEDVAQRAAAPLPALRELDTETLVRVNAAVQLGAGALLGMGRVPRSSALVLAASLVPTTLAAHRFWEFDEHTARQQQRIHFLKNVGLLGGLLTASMDTEGRPGIAWRVQHGAKHARTAVRRGRRKGRLTALAVRKKASR